MNYITITELRTKGKDLMKQLQTGKQVDLIYRSKVVGEIRPKKALVRVKPNQYFQNFLKKATSPLSTTNRQREKKYRQYLVRRHAKRFS